MIPQKSEDTLLRYHVLLFYKFIPIELPEALAAALQRQCKMLELLGRIIVAPEGLNGTISGTAENTSEFARFLKSDTRFSDLVIKTDSANRHAFKRLSVRVRPEIVTLGSPQKKFQRTGVHLKPSEFLNAMDNPEALLIDVRNEYEYAMGHFRNAVRAPVRSFKEFPAWIRSRFNENKERPILTYCTGGIRCEKLTGFLLEEGFENVFQLEGGILAYSKDPATRGKEFEGRCFVFDERIGIRVNQEKETILTECKHCRASTDRMVNCANLDCHASFYVCPDCDRLYQRSCSPVCQTAGHHEYRALGEKLFDYATTPRGLFKSLLPA